MRVNQLKAGVALSYLSLILGNVISIIYTPIMLRMLGQSEYGLYSLANSVVGFLGILNFGFGSAVIRYTAKYRAMDDKEGEYNLYGMFIVVYSFIVVLVAIVGCILLFNVHNIFSDSLSINELAKIKILVGLLIFNLAISFAFGVFGLIITAYEKFIFAKVVVLIQTIISPIILLVLLFLGYKSIAIVVSSTLINLICIGINMFYCFRILKVKIKFKKIDFSLLKEIAGYSYYIFLIMIVDKIFWSTDQFILGIISGTTMVAIYSIGSNFNTYYMSFSTAISGVFFPRVTQMVTKNVPDKELSDLFIKTGRIQYIIISFILGGFILVGRDFINLWAGIDYDSAYFIALIVMVPLTVPLIQTIGLSILQAKNMHKFRSLVYIVIAVLNVLISIPLAKILGGFGCALATAISMVIGHIFIMNIYYYKKINIDIPAFWRNIASLSTPLLISLLIGSLTNLFNLEVSLVNIIVKGSLYSFIFIICMWFIGINRFEKELFTGALKINLNKFERKLNI
ncbi:MAG: oligosaccharide flippase family protein [Bacillota bacterium]